MLYVMKRELQEWGLILVKTFIVTLLVALGATLCDVLHLPSWAGSIGVLPAGYVFCKLAGIEVPSVRHWAPQLLALMFFTFLLFIALSHLDGIYRMGATVLLLAIFYSLLRVIPTWLNQGKRTSSTKEDGEPS